MKIYKVYGCVHLGCVKFTESEIIKKTHKQIKTEKRTHRKSNLNKIKQSLLIDSYEIVFTDISKRNEYELLIRAKLLGIIDSRIITLNDNRDKLLGIKK